MERFFRQSSCSRFSSACSDEHITEDAESPSFQDRLFAKPEHRNTCTSICKSEHCCRESIQHPRYCCLCCRSTISNLPIQKSFSLRGVFQISCMVVPYSAYCVQANLEATSLLLSIRGKLCPSAAMKWTLLNGLRGLPTSISVCWPFRPTFSSASIPSTHPPLNFLNATCSAGWPTTGFNRFLHCQ